MPPHQSRRSQSTNRKFHALQHLAQRHTMTQLSVCLVCKPCGLGWLCLDFLGWVEPISRLVREIGLFYIFCMVGDILDMISGAKHIGPSRQPFIPSSSFLPLLVLTQSLLRLAHAARALLSSPTIDLLPCPHLTVTTTRHLLDRHLRSSSNRSPSSLNRP